jgi:hypothetical protein
MQYGILILARPPAKIVCMPQYRKEPSKRRDVAHRLLFYVSQRTSAAHPDWRDTTIKFLWDLYEIRDQNPAILVVVHKNDGIIVYHDAMPLAYFHFRQRHILVHAARGYLIWSKERRPFSRPHKGSWPLMWKCENELELSEFLRIVRTLPVTARTVKTAEDSRHIPQDIREFVLERDEGRCRAVVAGLRCRATTNLHFDHVIPYCRGGDSLEAKNVQLLCRLHNLKKGSAQRF